MHTEEEVAAPPDPRIIDGEIVVYELGSAAESAPFINLLNVYGYASEVAALAHRSGDREAYAAECDRRDESRAEIRRRLRDLDALAARGGDVTPAEIHAALHGTSH